MHVGGVKQFRPDAEQERARGAWLLAIDLADEAAGDAGYVRVFTTPKKVGRGGPARVSQARGVALYLATTLGDLGSRALGQAANMHRASVTRAVAMVEDQRDDPAFDRLMEELERRLLYRAASLVMVALGQDRNATNGARAVADG